MAQLTKKMWNSLTIPSKVKICDTLKISSSYARNIIYSGYYHDFSYSKDGAILKNILSHCRVQTDGTIDVVITITPEYLKEEPKRQKKQQQSNTSTQAELKRYKIDYEVRFDDDVDVEHCWYSAYSESDAISQFREEYGYKHKIIQVSLL